MPVCKSSYRQKIALKIAIKVTLNTFNKPVGAFIVHLFCYSIAIKETRHAGEPVTIARRVANMKGYTTAQGYMGYVDGSYMLFASEDDYLEYVEG